MGYKVYRLPEHGWIEGEGALEYAGDLGDLPNPRIYFRHGGLKDLGLKDLEEICSTGLDREHFRHFVERWGPWEVESLEIHLGRAKFDKTKTATETLHLAVNEADWRGTLVGLKVANWLRKKLDSGLEYPDQVWTFPEKCWDSFGHSPLYAPRLQFAERLGASAPWTFRDNYKRIPGDASDLVTALMKLYLGALVEEGLRPSRPSFSYNYKNNSFGEESGLEAWSLEAACWLLMRDGVMASLPGQRYCLGCGKALGRDRRRDADACRADKCKKRAQRKKRSLHAQKA